MMTGLLALALYSVPAGWAQPFRLPSKPVPIDLKLNVAPPSQSAIAPTLSIGAGTLAMPVLPSFAQGLAALPGSPAVALEGAPAAPSIVAIPGAGALEAALPKAAGNAAPDQSHGSSFKTVFDGSRAEAKGYEIPATPQVVQRDPETNLWGVEAAQLKTIVTILKKHYGDRLLDLAAIGSRARGRASLLKNNRPPTTLSDLDLAPLLKDGGSSWVDSHAIAEEIRLATGIPVELHGIRSSGETRYKGAVPFYGGGNETWEYFSNGDAVRIPLS